MTTKGKNPKGKINKIPQLDADFFNNPEEGGVLANAIQRGEQAINNLAMQDVPSKTPVSIKAEHTEINEEPSQTEQNSNFKKLEEFLISGQDRKNTIPVRITRRNYDRLVSVKKHIGGSRSIPQSIDYILDVYLAEIEKYIK